MKRVHWAKMAYGLKKVHRDKMPNVVKTVLWLKMHKGVKKVHSAKIVYGMKKAIEPKCLMG